MKKYFYKTILEKTEFELEKIKGSKFIGNIFHVENKLDIVKYLKEIQIKHKDAKHHCYAYRYGTNINFDLFGKLNIMAQNTKKSDAGEPNNTAGKPILTQIQTKDLHNVLVVISRYFGGILLGIGGLIQAYGECAKQTINNAKIEEIELTETIFLKFDYNEISNIINILNKYGAKIIKQRNQNKTILEVKINKAYINDEIISRYQIITNT